MIGLGYLKGQIISSYKRALVEGGEMVGPVAAQSIGEISTQLTLILSIMLVSVRNPMSLVVLID